MQIPTNWRKAHRGFTIVELAIVIIVISIIAMITIATYRGVQDRAKNAQTISAANQWLKALEIYKVRNGGFPTVPSCLGANYNYNSDGKGSSGVGQCRQDSTSYGVTSQASFTTALAPYISGNPTPAMVTAKNSTTSWYRGLYYYIGAGNMARLDMALTPANNGCPDRLGDVPVNTNNHTSDGNYLCTYVIGSTTGY
jgi:prepilin-type N-terminal cleavage/methylation domain-containing protein